MRIERICLGCVLTALTAGVTTEAATDSGEFAYKGQLKLNGVPVDDTCDFEFSLWWDEASSDPAFQVGPTLTFDGAPGNLGTVEVADGLFGVLLDFGPGAFNETPRWLEIAVRCPTGSGAYSFLDPREQITGVPYSVRTRGIAVDDNGHVGVGTENPQSNLHVRGFGSFRGNHIAFFESVGTRSADGIAIQLSNQSTNRDNNFLTFYNADEIVTGRVEGFDYDNGDWIAPPPLPNVNLSFDPGIRYNDDWFSPGSLPTATLSPGTLPTVNLNPGSLPTATLHPGSSPTVNWDPGTLPSLSFNPGTLPDMDFTPGTNPSLSFNQGTLPSLNINFFTGTYSFSTGSLPSANFSTGTLPSATFSDGSLPTSTFSRGRLPNLTFSGGNLPSLAFSGGVLPTLGFTPGTLPSLTFSGGSLPQVLEPPLIFDQPTLNFDLPTQEELEALFCWSFENGLSDFVTLDPVSFAVEHLKEQVAAKCRDEGVTYGSKGADYAEWLPKLNPEDRFQLGQIVGVHGGKISLKTADADHIMAVSHAPVVVGNVPPEDEKQLYATVGFMGQLPVVVRGKVRAGDYIIPSGREDGTAVAVAPDKLEIEHLGRVLGRAWSESNGDIYSLINVVIGLQGNEAKIIFERQRDRMAAQARSIVSLSSENARLHDEMTAMHARLETLVASVEALQDQSSHASERIRVVSTAEASN